MDDGVLHLVLFASESFVRGIAICRKVSESKQLQWGLKNLDELDGKINKAGMLEKCETAYDIL